MKLIQRIKNILRWIMVLPFTIIIFFVTRPGIIYVSSIGLFNYWDSPQWFHSLSVIVTSVFSVYIGTMIAPSKRKIVSITLGAIVVLFVSNTWRVMFEYMDSGFLSVIFAWIILVIVIGCLVYKFFTEPEKVKKRNSKIIKRLMTLVLIFIGMFSIIGGYFFLSVFVIGPSTHVWRAKSFVNNFCKSPNKAYQMTRASFQKSYTLAEFKTRFPDEFCQKDADLSFETTGVLSDENSVWSLFREKKSNISLGVRLTNRHLTPWIWKVFEISNNTKELDRVGLETGDNWCKNFRAGKFVVPNGGDGLCGLSRAKIEKINDSVMESLEK